MLADAAQQAAWEDAALAAAWVNMVRKDIPRAARYAAAQRMGVLQVCVVCGCLCCLDGVAWTFASGGTGNRCVAQENSTQHLQPLLLSPNRRNAITRACAILSLLTHTFTHTQEASRLADACVKDLKLKGARAARDAG